MTNERSTEADANRGPFMDGDVAVLFDRRHRRYRVPLRGGGSFSSHLGAIDHDRIIGRLEGFVAVTSKGHRMTVLRPTFQERVLDLPRQSQVIYPKDLGSLLMRCDFYPGANVVEIGLGSGAASGAILRAIGPRGSLVSYEVREAIVERTKRNVAELAPDAENHRIVVADAYETGIAQHDVDRVLMDLPEPWRLIDTTADALRTGGILAAFLPTVLQVHRLSVALNMDTRWRLVETIEIMERPWHVTDLSVRPEHRMVGHTGFITTARRCEPATEPGADAPVAGEDDEPNER
jgi:tRNA (adenine57-N1/adenine58-N1)-methyltransferase